VNEAVPHDAGGSGDHRYGIVLLLALLLVIFEVLASDGNGSRAVAVALAGAALIVAVATGRARSDIRRVRAISVFVGAAVLVVGIATGVISGKVAFLVLTLLALAVPLALIGGLVRLIRSEGVTVPAVSGALAIYLYVGLLFASAIGFLAYLGDSAYFAHGTDGSAGDRVYFSFTTMTTTGYGDFTPATSLGHAIAVVEMLLGQIYLVTVIGILVSNLARGRR
jgi:hypothetical protein